MNKEKTQDTIGQIIVGVISALTVILFSTIFLSAKH